MTDFDAAKVWTVDELADELRIARETGREIVPVVGAGISADSGIPVITSVVRYFGKLERYIALGAYLPPALRDKEPFKSAVESYARHPWKFVRDFRWPDRFQLNQDLLGAIKTPVDEIVRDGLNAVLHELNPFGMKSYTDLREALIGDSGILDEDGDLEVRKKVEKRLDEAWSRSVPFDLVGDWKKLIQHFSRFQGDYADGLFARLVAGRHPTQGHRFLAFLVRLLDVRTIFTYNFDDLIERALESEGMRPEVFAMEAGASLPHHTLVRESVAVIKLHGSTHALLLDEELDHPVTDDYKRRFGRIAGKDPLLFVVGCSGNDYRLRDLVEHVWGRHVHVPEEDRRKSEPAVIWFHYEPKTPKFLEEKRSEVPNSVYSCVTNNPGATLLHVYSRLRGCNPASRTPYLAHVQR
jgi:hypothetical protein